VPLIWGFQHGHLRDRIHLELSVPSECARRLSQGQADLGLVPVAEMARQRLEPIPGLGIACRGAVRSILLLSAEPLPRIRRLATDSGSRTSVALTRAILKRRYGADPELVEMDPDPASMLAKADAALLIGDSALRVDPAAFPGTAVDLGEEWLEMTGLPMVFAQWAGAPAFVDGLVASGAARDFEESLEYGLAGIERIVETESAARGFPPDLVRRYLTRHIRFRVGAEEERGMATFLRLLAEDAGVEVPAGRHLAGRP
jgi:predicted solute-binding protein